MRELRTLFLPIIGIIIGCTSTQTLPAAATARSIATAPVVPIPLALPAVEVDAHPKATCPTLSEDTLKLPDIAHEEFDVPVPDLEGNDDLAAFYNRLAAQLRYKDGEPIRIGMYGDSNMTADWITGQLRRRLQAVLGDGGHGFVALTKPWPWYLHMDVKHGVSLPQWATYAISSSAPSDKMIGFAGIAGESRMAGATTWVETAEDKSPIGKNVSNLDLYFLSRPNAGSVQIFVDDKLFDEVDAKSDAIAGGFHSFSVKDGPHKITFKTSGRGSVRLFGVVMERNLPAGVVVDSLGVGAMSALHMATRADPTLNGTMLARRKYDLVLDLVGTNMWHPAEHEKYLGHILDVHRKALPNVGYVYLSPPDLMQNTAARRSDPRIVNVGEQKRSFALAHHASFWDFRAGMGGDRAIHRFWKHGMAWNDMIHLNQKGAAYMADRLYYALWKGLGLHLQKHPEAGCRADSASPS